MPATISDIFVFAPGAFICGMFVGWILSSFFRIERVRRNDDDES